MLAIHQLLFSSALYYLINNIPPMLKFVNDFFDNFEYLNE
ncbi:hypothetical protein CUZ89_2201 [Enterococcus xinjiangensis]|nr:hypothetical protein [Enterococcus lactis]MBL4997547.1 hypothetical protein [Enterococcus lactis]MBL5000295.1 hypothetical protein [Enterococcus lactis]MBL5004018.1 hypothetical protein [Enterococcus lactis]